MFKQEDVDKLYPGAMIFGAMKFWSLPKNKMSMISEICSGGKYYGQTKKDGNWYEYSKSADGTPYLFSRGLSTKTGLPVEGIDKVPHIVEAFKDLPNNTIILGEIYYPGETTAAVRSIMGCLAPKALERQKEKGNIHFYLFDILAFNGDIYTEKGSLKRYEKLVEVFNEYNLGADPTIELADCVTEDLYTFLAKNLADGEEGSILKKKDALYVEDKAPAWSSIKWKKQDDVDLVCMGFEDPTKYYTGTSIEDWQMWEVDGKLKLGSYYGVEGARAITKPHWNGWKTSIKFGLYKDGNLVQIGTVSSGMNDQLRENAANHPEDYIGKVFKCNYMELTSDSIREPRFIEFRDDKRAEECLYEEVFK